MRSIQPKRPPSRVAKYMTRGGAGFKPELGDLRLPRSIGDVEHYQHAMTTRFRAFAEPSFLTLPCITAGRTPDYMQCPEPGADTLRCMARTGTADEAARCPCRGERGRKAYAFVIGWPRRRLVGCRSTGWRSLRAVGRECRHRGRAGLLGDGGGAGLVEGEPWTIPSVLCPLDIGHTDLIGGALPPHLYSGRSSRLTILNEVPSDRNASRVIPHGDRFGLTA